MLIANRVNPADVSAAGYGEHDPSASNDTEEGRQQNRRVEIVLVPDLSFMSDVPADSERVSN